MSGALLKFTAQPRSVASADNVSYITRESATGGDERALYLHNAEELRGADYRETRVNALAHAYARQDEELARPARAGGESRTHYRAVVSWDRIEEVQTAIAQVKQFLEENFAKAIAVVAVHQDTEHTHAHIWFDARQTDGRKVHLNRQDFKTLDDRWARQYAQHYGAHYEREHLAKKAETRAFKQARARGETAARPKRASRVARPPEQQEQERRNYGAHQGGTGSHQPNAPGREPAVTAGERELSRFLEQSHRAEQAARRALQQAERIRQREELEREESRGR